MGWFSDAISTVSNVFSGGGGSSWLGTAAKIGSEVFGAVTQVNAQKDAARQVQEGYAQQTAAIEAGNAAAQGRLDQLTSQSQPATDYLRRVIAQDPYRLTPGQQTGLEDAQRQARNTVASGGLRGAGRASVAVVNEASRRFKDSATTQNIGRADTAANQLANQNYGAVTQAAGIDTRGGQQIGAAAVPSADVGASANVANAALKGSVIGTLSSFIAGDQKQRANESRYKDYKSRQGEV